MTAHHKIETVQSAHHFEYLMQDMRVTYKRDLKVSVGSMTIDAREGDISSVPRWLAKLLAEQGIIEIQDSDISAYVSRAFNRERISKPHDLSGLDPDFYIRVHDYLEGLMEREKESITVSLLSFVASRLEKIVRLSVEEKELYLMIHRCSSEFKQRVLKI